MGPVELVITQFTDQVRAILISKFNKSISRVLQRLLKYFNGAAISTYLVLPSAGFFLVIFTLHLKDSKPVVGLFGSSL